MAEFVVVAQSIVEAMPLRVTGDSVRERKGCEDSSGILLLVITLMMEFVL
jgi:hypothetical protein